MSLPNLKALRTLTVKIGKNEFEIQPWSNRQIIQYETARDDALSNELNEDERREIQMELIEKYLLMPNIINKDRVLKNRDKLTPFEREVLLIYTYKLSRGVFIELEYKCPECKFITDVKFNIDKNVKIETELKQKEVKTKD